MENIESTHTGAKNEMMKISIFVQRNMLGIGQTIDLAAEQTYMRNAKKTGGISHFQTRKATVLKWVRSRSSKTKFVELLKEMTGIQKTTYNLKRSLQPSEIIKSDKIVERIFEAMEKQFMEPLDFVLEKKKLYNLVSGKPVPECYPEPIIS